MEGFRRGAVLVRSGAMKQVLQQAEKSFKLSQQACVCWQTIETVTFSGGKGECRQDLPAQKNRALNSQIPRVACCDARQNIPQPAQADDGP